MTTDEGRSGERTPPTRSHLRVPIDVGSDDVLQRILARMRANDASDAPDLAGAIAENLASRLEGTPLPDEVPSTIERLDDPSAEPAL